MGMSRKKHGRHLEAIEIDQWYWAKESSKNPQWLSVYDLFSVIKEDTLGPLNSASASVNTSNIATLEPNGSLCFFWLTEMESSHRAHLHIPEDLLLILAMLPLILTLMLIIVFNYILNILSYCRSALLLNKYIVLIKLLNLS